MPQHICLTLPQNYSSFVKDLFFLMAFYLKRFTLFWWFEILYLQNRIEIIALKKWLAISLPRIWSLAWFFLCKIIRYLICTKLLFFSEFFFEKSSAIIFIFKLKIMFWVSRHLAIKKRLHIHILEREKSLFEIFFYIIYINLKVIH